MKVYFILPLLFSVGLISCANQTEKTPAKVETETTADSSNTTKFTIISKQDSVVKDGESVQKYKNGAVKMSGMMKAGKRDGLWKSWYDTGVPWSETTFKDGVKNGPTTTWYENGKMRYKGFYTNDTESGMWTYWGEDGKQQSSKDYGKK
jgi:antitoxin component YwqK of YwqJK toxin-antitoxin module